MDMGLGNFSVSLAVKDMAASLEFYTALGFQRAGGDGKRIQIMRNGTVTLGLFHGLFDRNLLTFNPGWDADCAPLPSFTDVRELQQHLRNRGIEPVTTANTTTTGPASFLIVDPDGNQILFDQHVQPQVEQGPPARPAPLG